MRRCSNVLSSVQACGLVAVLATDALAQCATDWVAGSVPGVLGTVHAATSWDPDGAGPLPPVVVMGGEFTHAGPIAANHIVAFEPVSGTWSTFGPGFDGAYVGALAVLPSGELVAAGWFTASGTTPLNHIARWNGSSWQPLGQGVDEFVHALAVLPNGTLIAGGQFTHAGGAPAAAIASWDGSTWSAFPSPLAGEYAWDDPIVHALAVRPNGALVVGGMFSYAGGQLSRGIAEWSGSAWAPIGVGTAGFALALRIAANGDVLAGGNFGVQGLTVNGLARWNGTAWSALGAGPSLTVHGIHELPNGDILAGGGTLIGASGAQRAVRLWNGSTWSDLAGAPTYGHTVQCIEPAPNGDLVVAGELQLPGGNSGFGLLQPSLTWRALPFAFDGGVFALHRLPNGDLLAGGIFQQVPGTAANRIARFDGTTWSNLGSGLGGTLYAIAHLANGDPVAGSTFGVHRWDGVTWLPLGGGLSGQVNALQLMPNGDLIAAGLIPGEVVRWDGINWSPLPGLGAIVWSLAVMPDGTLAAAGYFPGGVATWDGATWNVVGGGASGATELAVAANGDLIAAGYFTVAGGVPANNIARWDGTSWHALGTGTNSPVNAVAATPDGGVAVTGAFTTAGGVAANKVARWDGSAWHPLGSGPWMSGYSQPVFTFAIDVAPGGEIDVGGSFSGAGGQSSANFARWTTSCPAGSVAFGAGCTGSGGLATLTAVAAPWVGRAYATRATGMPALGIAVSVTGFAGISAPLASVLPQAVPGCTLLVTPDLLQLHLPQAGAVDVVLALPASPSLAGQSFFQQVVALELAPTGSFVSATSTGGLSATIGSY